MKVDIQTLGTFNTLAHEGAKKAAASLKQLAGFEPTVEATSLTLATQQDVTADFLGRDLVGVTIEFSDAMEGTALLAFDEPGARTLTKNLPGGDADSPESVHSSVKEVGNIIVSGFVDGWANHLDQLIDISPPTLQTGSGADFFPDHVTAGDGAEHVLAFTSQLETPNAVIGASVYLFPKQESLERVLLDQLAGESTPFPLDKLHTFNQMTAQGTKLASENVTMMTGNETRVEVHQLSFLPVEQTANQLGDDPYVGVVFSLEGVPSGYLLILFDESSASAVVEQLGAGAVDGEFGDMHQSAIQELGNIMCSGFIDGWANVLGTSISHSPPEFVHDYASSIMDPIASQLATEQQYAFVFDSLVQTTDKAVTCEIFALPNEEGLKRALLDLDLDEVTAADDDALAEAMTADTDELF